MTPATAHPAREPEDATRPARPVALQQRLRAVLAGLWAGVLLCIGALAAPAAFATLASASAGLVAGRMFAIEADLSIALAVVLIVAERQAGRDAVEQGRASALNANTLLLLGTLACTVGYFALLPLMQAARSGQGTPSFAMLHGISGGLFVLKGLCVLVLAWRLSGLRTAGSS